MCPQINDRIYCNPYQTWEQKIHRVEKIEKEYDLYYVTVNGESFLWNGKYGLEHMQKPMIEQLKKELCIIRSIKKFAIEVSPILEKTVGDSSIFKILNESEKQLLGNLNRLGGFSIEDRIKELPHGKLALVRKRTDLKDTSTRLVFISNSDHRKVYWINENGCLGETGKEYLTKYYDIIKTISMASLLKGDF